VISRDELLESARVFDLGEADVQRDYVFGWLIAGIFRDSALGGDLVLKGGNALRKGYFPGTRFSDDLDLSSSSSLNSDRLLHELNNICDVIERKAGVSFDTERNRLVDVQRVDRERQAFKFKLYFKDFLGPRDHITLSVRMDLTEFDRLYLPVQERQLIHPYSDADACSTTIRCVKLEEALADKLKCLLQRRYCYDLFDVVYAAFVAKDIEVNRSEVMQVFLRKTIFGASPHAAKSLLLDLPVDIFRGYWHKVLTPAASRMGFDEALESLRSGVESLFGPLPAGAQFAGHFFPSHLRNPIMQAASDRKLLQVRYDGVTRLVEPYSLTFKRRLDGNAFEYFYVFDRSGGRSSHPGIKTFFQHKIQFLEITDETFEPRFEMELTKAGDADLAGTFAAQRVSRQRSGIRTSPTTSRPRKVHHGPTYVIECSYCGKRFKRTRMSNRLNKHTDRHGNQCFGRSGLHVDTI
jgi:predicted nucleotidyltransferase component of viral defense system